LTQNNVFSASFEFSSSIGYLTLTSSRELINRITCSKLPKTQPSRGQPLPLLADARDQLIQFLKGKRKQFDLPLDISALKPFQKDVLALCADIPYGQIRTYGQIAAALGKSGSARAVGAALAANPLLMVIPCHRVVAADGRLTGYAGGLAAKQFLLELEGHTIVGQKLA